MHKYFYIFFIACCLSLGSFIFYQNKKHNTEVRNLHNKLALSEQLVRETKDAWSSRAIEVENLKSENAQLQKVIKNNDEEIFAISQVSLRWQNKYYQIRDARQTIVSALAASQPASLSVYCADCIKDLRFRVDFNQTQDDLKVSGYTVTNPPEAFVNLEWQKDLTLNLTLTRDKSKSFKVYLDSKSNSVIPVSLNLKIDPSILERKWYEKIGVGADILGSQYGFATSIRAFYAVKSNLFVGAAVQMQFVGQFQSFYGVSVGWLPFAPSD